MNSKWWFRGSSGPVSCSCQTSVWRLRGAGNGLLRPLLGRPMAAAARACAPAHGPVHTGRPSTGFRVFACVCLLASSSLGVCHRRVCPCDRVRVRASESAIRGRLSTGGPLGLRITGGSCVLGGSVKPRVCACAKGTVGALGRTAKKPNAPLAPHPCVRRGSERACGRRVSCPPSSHSSSQEISALCPALRGHGGSREMR